MKKRYAYTECYRILDVNPACSWDELRRAYKHQIQKWHPDRFADKTAEKEAADDKIKRITAAHQQLVAYYRQHGKLPAPETEPVPQKLPQPDVVHVHAATSPVRSRPAAKIQKKSGVMPVVGGLIIIGILFWLYTQSDDLIDSEYTSNKPNKSSVQTKNSGYEEGQYEQAGENGSITVEPVTGKFITYGSSIGEVISIQGPPDKDEGDIWYYGDSELYFEKGKVTGWKHISGSGLKTGIVLDK
ncbi:MAG: hypothetical protein QG652_1729 [Pseudomonadota bacterium]|nr:hypothetical protein [Pseudomonadota bacterium]